MCIEEEMADCLVFALDLRNHSLDDAAERFTCTLSTVPQLRKYDKSVDRSPSHATDARQKHVLYADSLVLLLISDHGWYRCSRNECAVNILA